MKGLRRLGFILIVALLAAAIPVAALASEDILRTSVQQAEAQFDRSLTRAIANGLDPTVADQLMWRYSQVAAAKPSAWWQAPAVSHNQLDKLGQLQADLVIAYQRDLSDRRDGYFRALHTWSGLLSEARNAGVLTDDLGTAASFVRFSRDAITPNDFVALSQVLAADATDVQGRLAGYRSAKEQASGALQNAQALLSSAGQYSQLNLDGFAAQLAAAASDLNSVHTAAGFQPIMDRLQGTSVAVQNLLNARAAAFSQLAATRSTLAMAQSIGADLGNHVGTINGLAAQLNTAGDQATFQFLSGRLYQEKQALANAIWLKQMAPVAPANLGVGKVIVISLSRQVLTAYQDGSAVLTTFVATGRPALPTPPGVYHVFARMYHFYMVSPWPYGSPYWYPNSLVNMGLEFRSGGYFIHDASWRSWYGPGSNLYNGTHGCVNVPYNPMTFLWGWAPIGTTVIVQY